MNQTAILRQDFKVEADAAKLSQFRSKLYALCVEEEVPAQAMRLMVLAVDEAISNIIEHADLPENDKCISITVEIGDNKVVAAIRDRGSPFDPTPARKDPDKSTYPRRGFGLYLIHKIVDTVSYQRTADGQNVLTLTKAV